MPTPRRCFLKSSAALAAGMALPCDSRGAHPDYEPPAPPPGSGGLLPTIKLGKYAVTRLVIGANPFYGYSHFNKLFSDHMVEWCTTENVCKTLRLCEQNGINTWQFSHSGRGLTDIQKHREEGGKLQWFLLSSRALEDDLSLIGKIAKMGPIGIVHHGGTTDRRWRTGEQAKIKEFLKAVRDSGVMVGLSTHTPMVVEEVESQGWDVDFFMTAMYRLTRTREELENLLGQRPLGEVYLPQDPPRMCKAVRTTKKTCFAYKVLAAGRVTDQPRLIDEAFKFVYDNIKPNDAMIVGMYPRYTDQVRDNCERARRILAGS